MGEIQCNNAGAEKTKSEGEWTEGFRKYELSRTYREDSSLMWFLE